MVWFLWGILVGGRCTTLRPRLFEVLHPEVGGGWYFSEDAHQDGRNYMYVAVRVLLWHMSHPVSVWGNPPALKNFSMWGRQCRELPDQTLAWAQVKGSWKCGSTCWGPEALKEMKQVSEKLAPVGGGRRACPLCPPLGQHGAHCGTLPHCES